jgi:hypothetical protein
MPLKLLSASPFAGLVPGLVSILLFSLAGCDSGDNVGPSIENDGAPPAPDGSLKDHFGELGDLGGTGDRRGDLLVEFVSDLPVLPLKYVLRASGLYDSAAGVVHAGKYTIRSVTGWSAMPVIKFKSYTLHGGLVGYAPQSSDR